MSMTARSALEESVNGKARNDGELNRESGTSEVKTETTGDEMPSAPLRHSIDQALDRYFADLDGTEPSDLYAMVICEVEQPLLRRVLDYTGGNQSRAAEILGVNRSTLRKKLRHHGLIR